MVIKTLNGYAALQGAATTQPSPRAAAAAAQDAQRAADRALADQIREQVRTSITAARQGRAEAGFPTVLATGWSGVMVPSATPRDIVEKINSDVVRLMSTPEMKSRLQDQGFLPVAMSIAEAEKFIGADVERWAKVIREGNIKSE